MARRRRFSLGPIPSMWVDEELEAEIQRIDELEAEISEKRHARREAVAWLASDLMYELVRDRMSLEQWTKRLHPDEMVNVVDAVKLLIDRGDVVVDRQGGSAQYSKAHDAGPRPGENADDQPTSGVEESIRMEHYPPVIARTKAC